MKGKRASYSSSTGYTRRIIKFKDDASIATTSVWFGAADLGLGCVWVSAFDTEKQKE